MCRAIFFVIWPARGSGPGRIRFPVQVFPGKIRKILRRKIVKKKFVRADNPLGLLLIVIKGMTQNPKF